MFECYAAIKKVSKLGGQATQKKQEKKQSFSIDLFKARSLIPSFLMNYTYNSINQDLSNSSSANLF